MTLQTDAEIDNSLLALLASVRALYICHASVLENRITSVWTVDTDAYVITTAIHGDR